MELLIGIGIVFIILYFLNQNRTQKNERTTITQKQVIQTQNGEIHIERKQTIDSVRTIYTKSSSETISPIINNVTSPSPELKTSNNLNNQQPTSQVTPLGKDSVLINNKMCPNCTRNLSLENFRKSGKHADGYTKWCIECLSQPKTTSTKKHCPNCKKNRLKVSFYKNTKREDGLTLWCKTCMDQAKR